MSDDRPRAPTYGPPITIPYFLGLVAYNAWCEAHLDDPVVDWMELSEAERDIWQIPELVCHSASVVVGGGGVAPVDWGCPLLLNTGGVPPRRGT